MSFNHMIIVYTVTDHRMSSVMVTNPSDGHYGLWTYSKDGMPVWRGDFFRAKCTQSQS